MNPAKSILVVALLASCATQGPQPAPTIPACPEPEPVAVDVPRTVDPQPRPPVIVVEDAALKLALDEAHAQEEALIQQLEQAQRDLAAVSANRRAKSPVLEAALAAEHARSREAQRRLAELMSLAKELAPLLAQPGVDLRLDDDLVRIEIQSERLFESRRAALTADGEELVETIAPALAKRPQTHWRVEGHFDNVVIRQARFPNSRELTFAQASTVADTLERNGVLNKNLAVTGFGEARPIADNKTEEGRAQNRRIDIVVMPSFAWLPGATVLRRAVAEGQNSPSTPGTASFSRSPQAR